MTSKEERFLERFAAELDALTDEMSQDELLASLEQRVGDTGAFFKTRTDRRRAIVKAARRADLAQAQETARRTTLRRTSRPKVPPNLTRAQLLLRLETKHPQLHAGFRDQGELTSEELYQMLMDADSLEEDE